MRSNLSWKLLRKKTRIVLNFRTIGANIVKVMAITMTATVIIMTLNNICNNIVGVLLTLAGGVISGLLASFIFHKRTRKVERTKIVISPEIARKYHDSVVEYRTKISNETPQDAYDIRAYVRVRYKKKYLTLKLRPTPILHGNDGTYKEYDYQRVFPFKLTNLNLDTLQGIEDKEIINLYKSKKLELHHFNDEDTILEIIIMSVDSISGGTLDVQVRTFNYDDLKTKVKTGEFDKKTLEVNTLNDKTPE